MSAQAEPEIYETTRRYGTILENVGIDMDSRRLDLDDASLTENTRAAYPISHIPNMRVAFLSDIHGNFPALCLALELARRNRADRVICAGDTVGHGPHPMVGSSCDRLVR